MPTLVMINVKDGMDSSLNKKAYTFLEKLRADDTLPGLHIEPIQSAIDPRVRTGRVDRNFRAVLFKVDSSFGPVYGFYGIWPHDKAIKIARTTRLDTNPVNGVPEIHRITDAVEALAEDAPVAGAPAEAPGRSFAFPAPEGIPVQSANVMGKAPGWEPGLTVQIIHDRLGVDEELAARALAAPTEDALEDIIVSASVAWQADALLDLATGKSLEQVRSDLALDQGAVIEGTEDEKFLAGLNLPAARMTFYKVEDNDELRRIIDSGDFGAWRIFLHPQQREYAEKSRNGSFRLSGGAGTGKTVVAVHRARNLARANPRARVLLTTYTRNLADDLASQVHQLSGAQTVKRLGRPGVYVSGIDQLVWAIMKRARSGIADAVKDVLGHSREDPLKSSGVSWDQAIDEAGRILPAEIATTAFFEAEYETVILPYRVTTESQYLSVRRQGRGISLSRARRMAIWKVIAAYRSAGRAEGGTSFAEKAAIAASWLERTGQHLFDHVIVDESQDLTPAHFQLLRALVAQGPDDLFLCEDSHQRIYGQKVTLSHYGIEIRGRARRLTLNYRTTAQNLAWAVNVLEGGSFTDLEGLVEKHPYRSSRSGPVPLLIPAGSPREQMQRVAAVVRSWLPASDDADGTAAGGVRALAPETIAVLVPDKRQRDQAAAALGKQGLEVQVVDREEVKPGRPLVMTMHRAKGLEFTHVLLLDVNTLLDPRRRYREPLDETALADWRLRERSLLYVAATRARDVLAVMPAARKVASRRPSVAR
ncbi:UvrD-helicase domain-containing protein [Actinomyces israelii]|uniref:UvrD-helicase domain-containing protein n=1 Tax=Actinomyces israelii TaxID=1659 RepID=UPI00069340AA|nr:UvrD-helicase domain-containing protein [Actinomyces israelii]